MRYNFKRLSGREWYGLINSLKRRGVNFLEINSSELFQREKVSDICCAYFSRTNSGCKIIYYDFYNKKWHKRLREISFSPKSAEPISCVLTFKKIANKFNELLPYEPDKKYDNGVYTYYNGEYEGIATVIDMNGAYLHALRQPLADFTTKTRVKLADVFDKKYDFYSFENDMHCEMFYKHDTDRMQGAMLWADVKIYGYKGVVHYENTANELYRLKCEVDKERYKNVANIAIGCMHKHSGRQNNTTLVASLYAWFAYHIDTLVNKFNESGYNVIMVTTDSIKIKGNYNVEDGLLTMGHGLGEWKIEYSGPTKYYSEGHYVESRVKWKGKPQYIIDGNDKCDFIESIKKERKIYEKYAIV